MMLVYRPFDTIAALSFDLDDTLYDNYPVIVRAERGLMDHLKAYYPKAASLSIAEIN